MSGIHEIGLIAIVVLALFFLPRIGSHRRTAANRPPRIPAKRIALSGKMRLALLATVVWPLAAAAIYRPWLQDSTPFLLIGILPIVLMWGIVWVVAGFRKHDD